MAVLRPSTRAALVQVRMLAVRGWGYKVYIKVRGVGTRMNKGQNPEFTMCLEVKIYCQRGIESDAT